MLFWSWRVAKYLSYVQLSARTKTFIYKNKELDNESLKHLLHLIFDVCNDCNPTISVEPDRRPLPNYGTENVCSQNRKYSTPLNLIQTTPQVSLSWLIFDIPVRIPVWPSFVQCLPFPAELNIKISILHKVTTWFRFMICNRSLPLTRPANLDTFEKLYCINGPPGEILNIFRRYVRRW